MSLNNLKAATQPKPGQGGFPAVAPSSQAILLDKLHARRSTPDSEALASSDDEVEAHRQDSPQTTFSPHKPVRVASWLADTMQPSSHPRKSSFASSSMSPTTSHPSTPSAESGAGAWGSHSTSGVLGRGLGGAASFPWGTGIWTNDRKEPPSRLAEVLPSPTSTHPPGSSGNSFFAADPSNHPSARDQGQNTQIPFAIPLHPTPKTYRSQSYSVGQLEADASASSGGALGQTTMHGSRGGRPLAHSGLQHRPSRPSMLSEMSSDGSMLGKVNEDDDDGDSNGSSPQTSQQLQSVESKTIEMLTRENAMLRQQNYQNSRLRPRASTAAAYGLGNGYGFQESVPEESDFAIDELDESLEGGDPANRGHRGRRMSEFGAGPYRSPFAVENRKLENVKKAFWQSSLGFGGLGDIPQSRRHSFADVPARQGSVSSIGEPIAAHDSGSQDGPHSHDFGSPYSDGPSYPLTNPASYFNAPANVVAPHQNVVPAPYGLPYPSPYGLQSPYSNKPASPHRSMYGITQPRHNQLLHIVLFKCARADVFYIQEGTGLTVKPGDLVIVEADRGTDLGTVARDNVDWATGKELKEHYAEEHYKWLMMYSHNAAATQEGAGAGLMAASRGRQGSAVGGMGPASPHHAQEAHTGELKPKLIKRLAQSHEVNALRDKEGNEAKAKRVCMAKVKEHGLNMEILDAEFQMDWKKLTFYYFADSYINFNSLVTDLFKIYKTRIWMSAINPASFASPSLGFQSPSGIGPGAVSIGRGTAPERRQNQQQAPDPAPTYPSPTQGGRGFQAPYAQPFAGDRTAPPTNVAYAENTFPFTPYGVFGPGTRPGQPQAAPGMLQALDSFPGGMPPGGDFQGSRGPRFLPSSHGSETQHEQPVSPLAGQTEWAGGFQGLSLDSR